MAHPLTSSPQLRDQIKVSYEFFTNEVDRLIITDETGAAGLHFLDWDGSQFIQAKYYPYLTNPRGIHIEHGTFAPPLNLPSVMAGRWTT